MGLTLVKMRSEVLEHLGLEALELDPDSSTTNIDLLINRAFWDLQIKLDLRESEDSFTFATVAGQRDYVLQTIATTYSASLVFEAFRSLFITDTNDAHVKLNELSIDQYESVYNESTSNQAQPDSFVRSSNYIRLYPTPDQAYTCTVYILKTISDANFVTIPQNLHNLILLNAVYFGHLRARDYNSAAMIKVNFDSAIKAAATPLEKENKNQRYAGVEAYRGSYY